MHAIASEVEKARQALSIDAELTVGVGIPGALDSNNIVKNANTQVLIGQPLLSDLESAMGSGVSIANDATCFVASEAADGAAANADVVFGVILGTGVGGGVAISGLPIIGENGLTGEWGHNPFPFYGAPPKNRRCYCGKQDCIEQFLAGPALSLDYRERTGIQKSAAEIHEAADGGDTDAKAVLADFYVNLAKALSTVINLLDPNVIVIGGGLSNIVTLYDEVPNLWGDYVFNATPSPAKVTTKLVKNKWGDDSGVRGAAWLTGN